MVAAAAAADACTSLFHALAGSQGCAVLDCTHHCAVHLRTAPPAGNRRKRRYSSALIQESDSDADLPSGFIGPQRQVDLAVSHVLKDMHMLVTGLTSAF